MYNALLTPSKRNSGGCGRGRCAEKSPRLTCPGLIIWNAVVGCSCSALLPADRGYPFPWIGYHRLGRGSDARLKSLELTGVNLPIAGQKSRVLSHFGGFGVGVFLGVAHAVPVRTHDGHSLDHILELAALLHAFLYDIEHRAEGVREAGAFNCCRTVFEQPFCIHIEDMLPDFPGEVNYFFLPP